MKKKNLSNLISGFFTAAALLAAVGCANPAASTNESNSSGDAALMGGSEVSFASSELTISGDIALAGNPGDYAEWTFTMSQSEKASVKWYTSGSSTKFNVLVNGSVQGGIKTLSSGSSSRSLELPSGTVKLRMEVADSDTSGGAITFSKVVIKSAYASSGSASSSTSSSASSEPSSSSSSTPASSSSSVSSSSSSTASSVNGDIVLSPGGDLQAAIDSIGAGKTIWLKGGTYNISGSILIKETNCGTSSAKKTIAPYGNGTPVLDWNHTGADDKAARGMILDGDHWYIKGVTFREAGDNGMLLSGNNNTIDRCLFVANRDTGLQLSRYNTDYDNKSQWPSNNLILQCESYDNADTDGEDADGFAAKLTVGEGNIFRGCYAHHNIDDGWDLYTKSATGPIGKVTLEYCIAAYNGTLTDGSQAGSGDKNGFKLGGGGISVDHTVRFCIAAFNGKHGFTYNRNLGNIKMTNNTSYSNGSGNRNFNFDGGESTFYNNISLDSKSNDRILGSSLNPNYNAWWEKGAAVSGNGVTVTADDFVTLTPGTLKFTSDGRVELGDFLKLKSGSDLVGSGSGGANMGAW